MSIQDRTTLGVGPDASWKEIKIAYRNLCRVHHPDVVGPNPRFTEITVAYSRLEVALGGPQPCGACRGTGRVYVGGVQLSCLPCGGVGKE